MIEKLNLTGWARDDAEQAMEQKLNEIIDVVNAMADARPRTINDVGDVVPVTGDSNG